MAKFGLRTWGAFLILRNESGQGAVEYILITAVLLFIGIFIFDRIKTQGTLVKLADGPTELLQGMVESGVWRSPKEARSLHPTLIKRKVSMKATSTIP